MPNEALHNFVSITAHRRLIKTRAKELIQGSQFQGLLATKSKSSTGASARDTKDSKSIPPVDE